MLQDFKNIFVNVKKIATKCEMISFWKNSQRKKLHTYKYDSVTDNFNLDFG